MKSKIKSRIGYKFVVLFAAFLIALSVNMALAGNDNSGGPLRFDDWEVVGPSGGDVRVIAIDPQDKNRLYVSTLDGQIHTSANGGQTWRLLVNFNRPSLVLDQLFVDPRDSKVIYASGHRHTEAGGFFKTTDGGLTWKEAKELKNESIHAMTQSTLDLNILTVGSTKGVWISKNSGDTWTKIESETMPININSMAIDPRTNNTIYAGTWWRPYKSTDGGKSWRLIKNGLIDDSDVFAITIDTRNAEHVIASACSGIYESFNGGEKWAKIQGIPSTSRRTRDILQHPTIPGTIYAATTEGFWMSTNGGKSWMMTTPRTLEINSIAVHPEEPNKVFIGTNNYGVMVSIDGGKNFKQTNDKFTSRFTYSVTADIEQPNRLYATTQNTATGGGFVFISNDGGKSWEQPKNLDVIRVQPFALIQDRTNTNTLFLGTNMGIYRSDDRGVNWTLLTVPKKPAPPKRAPVRRRGKAAPKPTPTPIADIKQELIPAIEEKVKVFAYTEDGKNGILAGTDTGIYRSYDVSKGWEKITFGEDIDKNVFAIHTSPLTPQTIWVGTAVSGVIVSRDEGETWHKVPDIPERVPISSIAGDPKDKSKMYVGTTQTFYVSRDGGKSWTRRGGNLPLGNYSSILINPRNTDEIFIASSLESDGGIYYSNDAGWIWKRIDSKDLKLPSHRVWSMIFDPTNPNRIYAGTHSSGVYRIDYASNVAESKDAGDGSRPRVATSSN